MSTKWGLICLIGGGYLMAFAIAGINATSGGALAFYIVVLILSFIITGWSIVLPWDDKKAHAGTGPGAGTAPGVGAEPDVPASMSRG